MTLSIMKKKDKAILITKRLLYKLQNEPWEALTTRKLLTEKTKAENPVLEARKPYRTQIQKLGTRQLLLELAQIMDPASGL